MWTVEKPEEVPQGFVLVERPLLEAALLGDRFTDADGRRWVLAQRGRCYRCGDVDLLVCEDSRSESLQIKIGDPLPGNLIPDEDRRDQSGRWGFEIAPPAAAPPQAAPDRRRFSLWPFRRKWD